VVLKTRWEMQQTSVEWRLINNTSYYAHLVLALNQHSDPSGGYIAL